MLNRAVYVIGFLAVALYSQISLANSAKLTIFTEDFPPYNFSQNGKVTGINTELVKLMCEHAQIECSFESLPWSRAYHLTLNTPESGLISTSKTEKRNPLFTWIGPLASSKTYLYKLKTRTDINANTMFEAARYSVSIQRNDVYAGVLTKYGFEFNKNILESSYKNQALELFFAGKIDLIIGSDMTIPYQLSAVGKSKGILEPVVEVPLERLQGNFLALNNQTEPQIVEALNKAYLQLIKDNKIEQVKQQFIP